MPGLRRLYPQRSRRRIGAVTVEFALCVSIFFMFMFAMLEMTRFIYIEHAVQMCAYEGARAGVTPGAKVADVEQRVQNLMQATGVRVYEMTTEPAEINSLTENVRVTISCNFSDNSWVPSSLFSNRQITSEIALQHENMAYLRPGETSLEEIFGNNDDEPTDL